MPHEDKKQKKPTSIVLYMGLGETLKLLSDENAGKVIKAVFEYADNEVIPQFDDMSLMMVFIQARQSIDENFKKYTDRCEKNRQNIAKRYDSIQSNTNVYDGIQSNTSSTNATNKSKVNKIKENKSKDIDNIILHDTDKSETVQDATPVVAKIVLNDKSIYEVHQSSVDHYKELYPAVDIIQELRNMQGWCEANTANRKTRKGIDRFINSWLQKKQDRGTNQNRQKGNNNYDTAYERISRSEQNGDTYNDFTKPKKWL